MSVPSGIASAFCEGRRQLWVARASVLSQSLPLFFARGQAVVDALTTNQSLTSVSPQGDESIFDLAAKKAWLKLFHLLQKVFNIGCIYRHILLLFP